MISQDSETIEKAYINERKGKDYSSLQSVLDNVPDEYPSYDVLRNYKITIVIPAYNEEKRIEPVISDLTSEISRGKLPWDIVVAIDGDDGTSRIVESYANRYGFIQISRDTGRKGKGAAFKRGVNAATGDFTILMDADNSVSVAELMKRVPLIDKADVLILSRYVGNNEIPFTRKMISRGFNILLRLFLEIKVSDTQSGYKIFNTERLKAAMSKVSVTNTFFDVALIYYLQKNGSHIIETEVEYRHNDGSTFHPLGEVIGQGVSLLAFLIRKSRFYEKIPKSIVSLYYRKFRWI